MKNQHKKGVLDNLGGLIVALGTIAILASIIFLIIAESQDVIISQQNIADENNLTLRTAALNASLTLQGAASDIPGWFPIVVITIIGGILLGLVRFFKQ